MKVENFTNRIEEVMTSAMRNLKSLVDIDVVVGKPIETNLMMTTSRQAYIIVLALLLSSCQNFLNVKPQGKILPKTEEEYAAVLRRPKFGFSETTICHTLDAIKKGGVISDRISCGEELPDPKDLVFYEVTLSMDESYLVTGNIKHFPKKPFIVTPAEMLQIIHETKSPKNTILSEPKTRYGSKL